MSNHPKIVARDKARPMQVDAFFFHDTMGFPLSYSIGECDKRGWSCSLWHFYLDATAAGWSHGKAVSTILEHVGDVHPEDVELVRRAFEWVRLQIASMGERVRVAGID